MRGREWGLPGSWERKWSVFIRVGPSFKSTVTGSDGYFWMVTMAALCRMSVWGARMEAGARAASETDGEGKRLPWLTLAERIMGSVRFQKV